MKILFLTPLIFLVACAPSSEVSLMDMQSGGYLCRNNKGMVSMQTDNVWGVRIMSIKCLDGARFYHKDLNKARIELDLISENFE